MINFFFRVIILIIILHHALFNIGEVKNRSWKINIVHTNDMHSRFEETNVVSAECSPRERAVGQCYGGFARIATVVRQARHCKIPSLFLNAGDTYVGSPWYNFYKWKIVVRFLNMLQPDASTLGNHEFDDGAEGLAPLLISATFPIIVSNLDFSNEPLLAAANISKSVILNVQGRKIGIIGYLTPQTKFTSKSREVIFSDEIESIKKEVEILQEKGVSIIIGLGHSGYEVDKKIAAEVAGLDLIIGGHSHSFLYTGDYKPSLEESLGPYPTEIIQENGRKVYIVQAYAYTKYLGNMTITFDADGEITEIEGRPILLDNSIEQAPDIIEAIEEMRSGLDDLIQRPLGYTKVFLTGGHACKLQECNLGNLVTDAMVYHNAVAYADNDKWTDAAISVYNSGGIRASISRLPHEPITYGDVMTAMPFKDYLGKTTLTGSQLLQMLEHSVAEFTENIKQFSGLLQVSGIQVAYDLSKPVGSRVVQNEVYIRCADCRSPKYNKLNLADNQTYSVLMSKFIYGGGDRYHMIKTNESTWISEGITMTEILATYIENLKMSITVGVERRFRFINSSDYVNHDT